MIPLHTLFPPPSPTLSVTQWFDVMLELSAYRETGTYVVRITDDIITLLDDQIMKVPFFHTYVLGLCFCTCKPLLPTHHARRSLPSATCLLPTTYPALTFQPHTPPLPFNEVLVSYIPSPPVPPNTGADHVGLSLH